MLHEIEAHQYGTLRTLYAPLWYHLAIFSAIDGHTPSRVVVDDPIHPTVAMLWDKVEGGYYLAGDPDNAALEPGAEPLYPGTRSIPRPRRRARTPTWC